MTVSWAIGHMITVAIITVAIFSLVAHVESITSILNHFELGVAIMLIAIGILGILFEIPIVHEHLIRMDILVGLGGFNPFDFLLIP